jgi:NifU-like protein involved in Fe-S cluster formation
LEALKGKTISNMKNTKFDLINTELRSPNSRKVMTVSFNVLGRLSINLADLRIKYSKLPGQLASVVAGKFVKETSSSGCGLVN